MNLLLVAVTTAAVALATPVLAQNAPQQNRQQHSVNPSYDVYKNGRYLGSDPDRTPHGSCSIPLSSLCFCCRGHTFRRKAAR